VRLQQAAAVGLGLSSVLSADDLDPGWFDAVAALEEDAPALEVDSARERLHARTRMKRGF